MTDRKEKVFINAVRYIWDNIDQPIQLEDIAKSAGVSLSSLKRIFADATHQSPGEFLRRLRMELAFRSLQSRKDSVLEVALSAGFGDQSAFARCFKEMFGFPPTAARQKLNIVNELECVSLDEPDRVELAELPIQCITKQGLYYESAKHAWDVLKSKLTAYELTDDFPGVYIGIGHDNPHEGDVAPDKVRYSAGIALIQRDLDIEHHTIPGGQYARFHYKGKPVNLGLAYHYIYGQWSERANVTINKRIPAFLAYASFPEALKEDDILIHVPLIF